MTDLEEKSVFEEFEEAQNKFVIAKKRFRFLAFFIDFFVFWSLGMILGVFFGTPLEDEVGYNLNGWPAFVMFIFAFIFWPISEGVWGQTIGKRIVGLKVVTKENKPIGIIRSLIRFFLGFFDFIFLIGVLIAALNKNNQRIGDLVANTIVVKINKPVS